MALFDALVDDMASRFGLGSNAAPLVREGLALITGSTGGVSGFLDQFKTAGLSSQIASWMGHSNAAPLAAQEMERVIGASTLGGIASRLGLSQSVVTTALAYGLPKLIGLLTPNGVVPTMLPAEVTNFLAPLTGQVAPSSVHVHRAPAQPAAAPVAPPRVYPAAPVAHDEPALTRWLWPLLAALGVLGLALYFWPTGQTPAPVAQTPPVAPAPLPAVALLPPHLMISNDDGAIHVSGSVHDEETKNTILTALKSVFGADKVQGDMAVDLNRGAAPWLVNFRNAVEALKTPGVQAVFDGSSVNLGGGIADADLNRITASMRSVLSGGSLVFGTLPNNAALAKAAADKAAADKAAADKAAADQAAADKAAADQAAADKAAADKAADSVVRSNMKAATELASLKPESAPNDLLAALNDAIVNFPSGSAEVPASLTTFLQNAAHHLLDLGKQLPSGTDLEIAGYTDNSGNSAANVALSQKRAEAIRDAMIKAGANPDMLIAKGYGEADPIASNDTPEGRFKNRRIEYRLVKAP